MVGNLGLRLGTLGGVVYLHHDMNLQLEKSYGQYAGHRESHDHRLDTKRNSATEKLKVIINSHHKAIIHIVCVCVGDRMKQEITMSSLIKQKKVSKLRVVL